jgi:Zn-dependent protease with chaperone function
MEGLAAILLFVFYLCTIWYFAHGAYKVAYQSGIGRRGFIVSSVKINLPVIFPWLVLSLLMDVLSFTALFGPGSFVNSPLGQIFFFSAFLVVIMIFMPPLIRYWWGCRPFGPSEKVSALESFMRSQGFRYRSLLRWPIFEGRMMTAGIMGILPRYRYILITDALMEVLTVDELQAVTAHEMGHAKYKHLLFYILFFLGYMVLSLGLFDLMFFFFAAQPIFIDAVKGSESQTSDLLLLTVSIPMLLTMLVYFRFVMGFFMRNFERQADLYSAVVMGGPEHTIRSLEKIALLSGKIRDLPSWHHFSIKERVETLWRSLKEPAVIRRHNRFVGKAFILYLVCTIGLGYLLNFSPMKQVLAYNFIGKALEEQISREPENLGYYEGLAMLYHETGRVEEAMEIYERILRLSPDHHMSLNNLAWLLVTSESEEIRDPSRAVLLAERAVAQKRSPVYLDTLAEAYYRNGQIQDAVKVISEAVEAAEENRQYYEGQLKKFQAALGG